MLYGHADRGDANAGATEKSQKVHSINYKIGVILQKEVQSLDVEEKNVACSITVNQRIQATRFRNKLQRSVELTKHHDKIRARFTTREETRPNRKSNNKEQNNTQNRRIRCSRQPPSSATGYSDEDDCQFSLKRFTADDACKNRPQTALEARTKQWNKNAEAAKARVVRAKSAPARSWRNCADIMRELNWHGGGFYSANRLHRPLSRAKFVEIFDNERFQDFRNRELLRQKNKMNALVESFEPLKLEEWYPGPPPVIKKKEVNRVTKEQEDERKFNSFITRVDSIL
eukprot:gene7324-8142_t